MAIQIKNTYSGRTDNTDTNYPYGKGRNVVGGVEGTGTPFEAQWYNNLEGFLQGLLLEAGITPDGQVDNANSSQLVEAVKGLGKSADKVSTKTDESVQDFIDTFALKIFQSPTDGGLTEIQTRTVDAGEVYEVRKTSDNSLATIYSDAAGTIEIVQNGTSNVSDSAGVVEFYIADGDYYVEVESVKSNFEVSSGQTIREKTISQAIAEDADVGVIYNITDLNLARYEVVDSLDSGGFYYSSMASGRKLRLFIDGNTVIENFGNPVNNDVINSAAQFVKTLKFSSDKTYNISNITLPDYTSVEAYETTVFKKSASGFIFDLGRLATIKGGALFDGSYSDLGYTGNSIVIPRGDNHPDIEKQGHQRVIASSFTNSDSYHILYPVANKGWMSSVRDCKFLRKPVNAPANVKWPDEPTNGGNRQITGGYSAGPVCNVGGCDNGFIGNVECGAVAAGLEDQFIYFDDTAVNGAAKLRVIGNRPAIAAGTMNVRNVFDSTFEGNIFAGNVVFEPGCINNTFSDTNITTGVTDNSGEINKISLPNPIGFIPSIKQGLTIGDGSLQGEYTRDGIYIQFRIEVNFGDDSAVTGTMVFDTPVPVFLGGTREFIGTAWGGGYAGISYISQDDSSVRVYSTGATPAVWNATTPKAWVSGDILIIEGRYRV